VVQAAAGNRNCENVQKRSWRKSVARLKAGNYQNLSLASKTVIVYSSRPLGNEGAECGRCRHRISLPHRAAPRDGRPIIRKEES
jgi:hypothetical protein